MYVHSWLTFAMQFVTHMHVIKYDTICFIITHICPESCEESEPYKIAMDREWLKRLQGSYTIIRLSPY